MLFVGITDWRFELKIQEVENRGILFSFEDLNVEPYNCMTNVYVVIGANDYYICDTYLGPLYMKKNKSIFGRKLWKQKLHSIQLP